MARCPDAQLWLSISNSARNSSMTHSNFEFASLELQRFWGISKNDRDKLRARFGRRLCRFRPRALQPGPAIARGHRSQALRTGGVWCAVIASPDAASHSVQSSPCSGKTRQIVPFWVSRASFVPEVGPCDSCRASFVSPWHPPRSQLSALRRPWAPRPATEPRSPPWLCGLAASFTSEVGVLHYTKPSGACHRRVGASCSAIPPVWWR